MNRALSWFCKIFLKPLVDKLFIREVRGLENIPRGNFILVSNHQSYLDIIFDAYVCVPRRFHFIGQYEGFKIPLRWLILLIYFLSGVIPLNRKDDKSREKAIEKAMKALKRGGVLIIYPEGRRSVNGEIQEGKFGAAKIFLKTKVPILPVGIKGVFELWPPGGKLKIEKIVKINIGKPLFFEKEFEETQKLDENSPEYFQILQKITNEIMLEVKNLFNEL